MAVLRPCLMSDSRWLTGCSGMPRRWRLASLGAALLGCSLAAGEAPVQSDGCVRCGAAPGASAPPATRQRSWRKEARRETRPKRKFTMAVGWAGGSYTVCVRACDGSFFPVSYAGAANRSDTLEQVCRSLCPNADVTLYSFPFGGTIEEAVSSTGEPYTNLKNAGKFEQSYDRSCSCRAPGQSWAQALANAEAKYAHHFGDILVTVENAERMSRAVEDLKPKPATANSTESGDAALVALDINGVDTTLRAATAAISRETSGIHDEDAQRPVSFGLKQGQTIEEKGPDGSTRQVRVLPTSF
jgi:hypothetical protein